MALQAPVAAAAAAAAGLCQDRRCDNREDASRRVWYCKACASCLCDVCWEFSPIHSAPGALRHDKLAYREYLICTRLEKILNPPTTQDELEKLHDEDTSTTWFGIDRYDDGRPFLQDFETYSHLMASSPRADQVNYPQLVSFIGETSAGKSTLIKMLIDYEESKANPAIVSTSPSPVAGSHINDSVPTSADVHLYSDPATRATDRPILYADCEGLNAGERVPMGAHGKRIARLDNSRRLGLRVRPLEWANSDETRTRQYAVTQIYPRLLYTFSDVVVFVLDKPKVFENAVLPKLFDWASGSLKASTNQGTLPHAIIALNFSDINIDPALWNVPNATKALLDGQKHVLSPLNGVPKLLKLADKWRRKEKRIHSILDLIHCYYASFQVVRIPDEKNLLMLSKQVSQLHTTIAERCEVAYRSKKSARLLSSADDFGFYIQQAFGHFSRDLNLPFDFKEYGLRRNPIPQNLGDHILRMAISLHSKFPDATGQWIFEKLSFMVASCFQYNCLSFQKGQPDDLFADYLPNFEAALVDFCNFHWPCEFVNRKGRCVNTRTRHESKGHQNEKGRVLAAGDYVSTFTIENYKISWMKFLRRRLEHLQKDLNKLEEASAELEDPLISIRKQHMENITSFFYDVGGATRFKSHATCLCCLMRAPEHALQCGHVLCSSCIRAFGVVKKTTIEMQFCPLHPLPLLPSDPPKWEPPWKIRIKPDFAGIRVLSLDGGGIRGIAELEVLRQIQCKLGVNIPIPAFFDLIVGTSTGGIIALALGVKQWHVEKCIDEFKRLCNKAFTPREFHGVWGFKQMATAHHGSIWQTTPLYQALQESLGTRFLFGGEQDSDTSYSARVAVTTSSDIAKKGTVIANYCRKGGKRNYEFLRPNDPKFEMQMWEAGAATSAAAPYFKPFIHERTDVAYLDGAFHNNNPVKVGHLERQILWTDVQEKPPDLFLSLGTTQDRTQVQKELVTKSVQKSRVDSVVDNSEGAKVKASNKWRNGIGLFHVGKAALNLLGDVINCERQWREFLKMTVERKEQSRYIRINPDIRRTPPPLDAKEEVGTLQKDVAEAIMKPNVQLQLEEIVFRLVASSFYFDKDKVTVSRSKGTATVYGSLQCRFEKSSDWLKQLGLFFKKQQRSDFQPRFEIWNGIQHHSKREILMTETIVERMASHGDFNIGETSITVSTTESKADIELFFFGSTGRVYGYSISGFPRDFLTEDEWTLHNSEGNEEEQDTNDETRGIIRARTRQYLSSSQDQELDPNMSKPHIRSASEQNFSTQHHEMKEENRRKSHETVPKAGGKVPASQDSPKLIPTVRTQMSLFKLKPRRGKDGQPDEAPPSESQTVPSLIITPQTPREGRILLDRPQSRTSITSAHSDSHIGATNSSEFSYPTDSRASNRRSLPSRSITHGTTPKTEFMESATISHSPTDLAPETQNQTQYPFQYPSRYYESHNSLHDTRPSSNAGPSYFDHGPSYPSTLQVHANQTNPITSAHQSNAPAGPSDGGQWQQYDDTRVGNILRDTPESEVDWDLEFAKKASMKEYQMSREEIEFSRALENSLRDR